VKQRLERERRDGVRNRGDPKFELAVGYSSGYRPASSHLKIHFNAGTGCAERREDLRQSPAGDGLDRAKTDRSGAASPPRRHVTLQILKRIENLPGPRLEVTARLSQHDSLPDAVEQLYAQLFFEFLNVQRHGRLRVTESSRCGVKRPGAQHRRERNEMAEIHDVSISMEMNNVSEIFIVGDILDRW
jgi:hypothetical protein